MKNTILTINGGSSSIKFAVFSGATRLFWGQIERIGLPGTQLIAPPDTRPIDANNFEKAAQQIIHYLKERLGSTTITGIGHRVVHGGIHLLANQLIDQKMIDELRRNEPLDLAHLPREIALIESFRVAFPHLPQIACFDTAFHRDMPRVAQLLPIPHHYFEEGVRRFGFHGLSFTYLMQRLTQIAGPDAANGKIILAHLGSGASMAAVKNGKSLDTTMSFTPTAGLVMGTRPGDIDPGLLVYLMRVQKMSPDQMDQFISQQCGLQGLSETTSDMRDLLNRQANDPKAADAVNLFVYQAKKFLGALCAVLGGLDTVIFSGGIGEHSPQIRAAICNGLDSLGISFDPQKNTTNADIISTDQSRVTVRVIPTDEEIIIAQAVQQFIPQSQ
jgi:acetate kinase